MLFGGDASAAPFSMFSLQHILMILLLFTGIFIIYLIRKLSVPRSAEILFAVSLLLFEAWYQAWLIFTDRWALHHALPLELSNISVILAVVLLIKPNKLLFEITFLVGIGGAIQAVITPVLSFGWPHFRFVHFFYTHIAVIWAVFYFLWNRGFTLTYSSVWKAMVFLNVLLPFIWMVNVLTGGNYWFIMEKPEGDSLVDFFGDHPWYILGMEASAVVIFLLLVFLFGNGKRRKRLS
ncbi:TIGR02206 family membrane protein [Alkalicoccus daliensis]|uniref:Conserved hypothetical integral membrane protein TIGR02206 n=1 Tax=Alkalicoccus daliensis TaxID=745820 RepID=A0A1H0DQR2_9BACI|nr:TIGR02206 family membrane protein [Alkalicoccus daliensis]SDN72389.1 conserved hypothetical integral membrane protein TIGR02206 [Alkalicoccus daliensis]